MHSTQAKSLRIAAALATIYMVWGSTYLAIRIAVESIPPFLMAGTRFLLAGIVMALAIRILGGLRLSLRQWCDSAICGALMLVGGNGLVCWAETSVPSGVATLIIAVNPIFFVLGEWILASFAPSKYRSTSPNWLTYLGLLLGTAGLLILIGPSLIDAGPSTLDPWRVLALVMACLCWTVGALYGRMVRKPAEPFDSAAAQMLCGGLWLLLTGFVLGEAWGFTITDITLPSIAAWLYLVIAGSIIAYTSFTWLIKNCSPTVVSTYAYVNPLVAVYLGWLIGGESLSPRLLVASLAIVAGVATISISRMNR